MYYLFNSLMVLGEGTYQVEKISPQQFKTELQNAPEIKSFIGYPENARILKEATGVEVKLNREPASGIQSGSTILCMKLPYRVANAKTKGKSVLLRFEDFEYYRMKVL